MRMLVFALAALALAACATPTPYQSADVGNYGFREQRIEANRVRITFRGNTVTDRATVETYLLYRAAEITLQEGKDYFIVADRGTDARTHIQGIGGRNGFAFDAWYFSRRHGWRAWSDPFWADDLSYREVTRFEAAAEIAMFNGVKPANDPAAFDARDVSANLQGRIVRAPTP